jgi:hypothetical protein
MRTDKEMRELLRPTLKGGMIRFVLTRGILFGVFLALGEALIHYLFGTNSMTVSTTLIFFPIYAIVTGTGYGIFSWYYLRRRYRITWCGCA